MSHAWKAIKKVASVALPVAAAFIPGIGPLAAAGLGAAGGALGGGGLRGALMGGITGGLGAGAFGNSAGSLFGGATTGLGGALNSINSGLFNAMSPLRSLVGGVSSGIGNIISPLKDAFGLSTSAAAPIQGFGEIASSNLPSAAEQGFLDHATGVLGSSSGGGVLSKLASSLSDPSLRDIVSASSLIQALNPQQPAGTLSQQDIMNQMNADKEKQQAQNAKFIAGLNADPLERERTSPQIDYYHYGERPESTFFDNVAGTPAKFAEGGMVGAGWFGAFPSGRIIHPLMLQQPSLGFGSSKSAQLFSRMAQSQGNKAKMFGIAPDFLHQLTNRVAPVAASPLQAAAPAATNRVQLNPNVDYANYGQNPGAQYFAAGGNVSLSKGMGGQDDTVDAKLSHGEFVIPADVVSHLGDGNTNAGAKVLDGMMKAVRKQKAPALSKGVLPPKAKSPLAYMGAM